jgi:HEAT repeat protein
MAKVRRVDAKLQRLRLLRDEEPTPAVVAELREFLADKSNLVVAEAAELVGKHALTSLMPDLTAAFHRFLIDPVETDMLCRAKIAIAEALNRLEADEEDVYRAGLRHVQREPCWGGSEDTAPPLRAAAAFALVRMNPRDLTILLADLLADPEKVARSAAAKALGALGTQAAIPLLRFKARVGDAEPDVVADCLTALVQAAPEESLSFVAEFLSSAADEIAEGAALALGESRRPAALDILKDHWPRARRHESLGSVLLLAVAITRLPAGLDFLIQLLADEGEPGAIAALAVHRHNPTIRDRVAEVVKAKPALRKAFEKEFRVGQ